ncbi:hypothetical protein TNCT_418681 [Trichonephila clavata]|uniref:Uncharacterized protein n=1 Tax=Trichonephila clavata TaxID=2740835 RepID=A0A8X6FI86_TRICU|nr:hypothetical protein TNCT_418681 [Trichonephila clavata]
MSDEGVRDFKALFESYCKFNDKGTDKMPVVNVKKWFCQAGLLGKEFGIEASDIEEVFEETAKGKNEINSDEFGGLVGAVAERKNLTKTVLMDKLKNAGEPKVSGFKDMMSKIC